MATFSRRRQATRGKSRQRPSIHMTKRENYWGSGPATALMIRLHSTTTSRAGKQKCRFRVRKTTGPMWPRVVHLSRLLTARQTCRAAELPPLFMMSRTGLLKCRFAIRKALRTYDMEGHVSEEKQVLTSPEVMIPADARAQLLQESGASIEELREQLTDVMGGQAGLYSIAYSYASHGRQTMLRRRIFNREEEIETNYNEQGDKASEITRTISAGGSGDEPPWPPEYSEARYTYQYDDYGNWTEQARSEEHT